MTFFENAIYTLDRLGVRDVILPFLLIFTISYAVLLNVPVLNAKKSYSVTIALVLALAVIFPHVTGDYSYSYGQDVVEIINASLPNVGLMLVVILGILILVGAFGLKFEDFGGSVIGGMLAVLSVLIIGYIFGTSAGWFYNFDIFYYIDPDMQALLVICTAFIIFMYLITGKSTDKSMYDQLKEFFKDLTQTKK